MTHRDGPRSVSGVSVRFRRSKPKRPDRPRPTETAGPTQNPVSSGTCGFDPHLRHQRKACRHAESVLRLPWPGARKPGRATQRATRAQVKTQREVGEEPGGCSYGRSVVAPLTHAPPRRDIGGIQRKEALNDLPLPSFVGAGDQPGCCRGRHLRGYGHRRSGSARLARGGLRLRRTPIAIDGQLEAPPAGVSFWAVGTT